MTRRMWLGCLLSSLFGVCSIQAAEVESVEVPGSTVKYPSQIAFPTGGKTVNMMLTGTAVRRKLIFNVYTIASYVPEGTMVKTADDLIAADVSKWLFIVSERDLTGDELANGFREAFRNSHGPDTYQDEINELVQFFSKNGVKKGDAIVLTAMPGKGLHINVGNREQKLIANGNFPKAVWEIYLGSKPLTDSIKQGLISRQ